MRMRGYSPEFALLTGMVANILVHEIFFERYEQPKSIYDMALMNTLGAIFGALPGCGMEAQFSMFTKEPTATFYAEDGSGNRYSIGFEQQRDFFEAGVPIEDRPVLPWHILVGAQFDTGRGDIGVQMRLSTREDEASDPLRAISGLGLGVTFRYQMP
jgi:hypothetical protein